MGALDNKGNVLSDTSYENVDIFAPGENITSIENGRIVRRTGTSVSTPLVTPAIAMLKAKCSRINNRKIVKMAIESSYMYDGFYSNEKKLIRLFNAKKLLENNCE